MSDFITKIVTPINSPVKKKKEATIANLEFTRRVDMKYLRDKINYLDMKTQVISDTLNKLVRKHNFTNGKIKTQKKITSNSTFRGGKRGKTLKKGVRKDNKKKRK